MNMKSKRISKQATLRAVVPYLDYFFGIEEVSKQKKEDELNKNKLKLIDCFWWMKMKNKL